MRIILFIAFLSLLPGCGGLDGLTVYAAASLTEALSEAGSIFEEREGVALRLNFASSATLARQIEAGAEADVFLSANRSWMDRLEEKGFVEEGSRRELLGNRLVIVASRGRGIRVETLPGTPLPDVFHGKRIAVGETRSVPAGIYARQALAFLGWLDALEANLVACDNVRSALMLVSRGEVEAGIVYLSDMRAGDVEISGVFPEESHDPIAYPAAAIAGGRTSQASAFIRFLSSPPALAVFTRHGFRVAAAGEAS